MKIESTNLKSSSSSVFYHTLHSFVIKIQRPTILIVIMKIMRSFVFRICICVWRQPVAQIIHTRTYTRPPRHDRCQWTECQVRNFNGVTFRSSMMFALHVNYHMSRFSLLIIIYFHSRSDEPAPVNRLYNNNI